MESHAALEITQLLAAWKQGDAQALDNLTPLVYGELRRLARHYVSGEATGHILQPTALVNEAFLRLLEWQPDQWQNRAHFFGISAMLMRRILVQYARGQQAGKRGGAAIRVSFADAIAAEGGAFSRLDDDLAALDEALTRLEELSPRQARIVELRFFSGLSFEEASEVMGIPYGTLRREWRFAKAWLHERLSSNPPAALRMDE
jgi:RNA polymerase sigma factor (TIGR02999 family)